MGIYPVACWIKACQFLCMFVHVCVIFTCIFEVRWTTEGSDFDSRLGQKFSLLHVVQTGSEAHPASYLMGTRGSFPGGKAAGA
jgi:hypothetical protein